MSKLDKRLSEACESFATILKWLLIYGGIVVVVEQITIYALNNPTIYHTIQAINEFFSSVF